MAKFREKGFSLHDVSWASTSSQPLGSSIEGHCRRVGPRPLRLWMLRQALLWFGAGLCYGPPSGKNSWAFL
eukprot:3120496-Karenia_brevis.AAC.1